MIMLPMQKEKAPMRKAAWGLNLQWQGQKESNSQHTVLETVALPIELYPCGAENETRTRDPNLGKVVLYQLSYFRGMVPQHRIELWTQGFSVPCSTN